MDRDVVVLPADLGRAYAAVSGDANPIHLYPLTARPFGYPRPIVQGMWTQARVLAALGGRLGAAYTATGTFTKPILLPGTATFGVLPDADGVRYAVMNTDASKPYLLGTVTN